MEVIHTGHLIKRSKGGHQTGKTHPQVDKKRRAMGPGTRVSRSGHRYVENRRNRSDRSRTRRI